MQVFGVLGIACLISGTYAATCSPSIPERFLVACGNSQAPSSSSCANEQTSDGRTCCYSQNIGCAFDSRQYGNLGTSDLQTYANSVTVPTPPNPNVLRGIVQRIPSGNSQQAQRALGGGVSRGFRQTALGRTLTLGLLLGTGGIANLFPRCPVHVKLCYRVPCGGYGDPRGLDNNPGECLKDPTCCYDYELAFLKSVFGPNVMGGAPSCYYGPTSQQWRYITSFFTPWNAWFTNFIVEAFKEVFNTKLFNIGGQVLCQFGFQVKNYPVGAKSELECNLVSGCWDASRPAGKQCTMASSLIKNIFGGFVSDEAIYPSLFTDDFDDTRCASNWFNFGPRAYRRMECDVKDEPSELAQKITDWCPWQDCCLNYAAFNPTQLAQVSLITSIGGGGSPIGGGILPISGGLPSIGVGGSIFGNQLNSGGGLSTPSNTNLLYLLAASSSPSLNLEALFCPYRNLFSAFIDLTETTQGCCEIPRCYHKKQFVGRPTAPTAPTAPPTIPPPIFTGNWGSWGPCNAACGQQGSRTRQCVLNGQPASSAECGGGAGTQGCFGPPCQQVSYSWGSWTASSTCSVTCGGGTLSYTRPCLNNLQQTVSSSLCPGGAGGATTTSSCNTNPCQTVTYSWGSWTTSTTCSVTCGGGTLPYSRSCLNSFQQVVSASLCPGGSSGATTTSPCNTIPCPTVTYSWGSWTTSATCSVTCGGGTLPYSRSCLNSLQQVVSASLCPGGSSGATTTSPCNTIPCPTPAASYVWGQWTSQCTVTCGGGTVTYTRQCLNRLGQPVASSLCPGGENGATSTSFTRCNNSPCPGLVMTYRWGEWTMSGGCSVTCGTGSALYTRQCLNVFGEVVSFGFCQGSARSTFSCSVGGDCPASYGWSGRYVASTRCSNGRGCGFGTQLLVQNCINTQTAQVVPANLCGPNQPTWRRSCYIRFCGFFG